MSQEPVRVSPFIKLARWSLLIVGVIYGAVRQNILAKKEEEVRRIEAEEKIIRDAQLAEERRRNAENEALAFELLSGTKKNKGDDFEEGC